MVDMSDNNEISDIQFERNKLLTIPHRSTLKSAVMAITVVDNIVDNFLACSVTCSHVSVHGRTVFLFHLERIQHELLEEGSFKMAILKSVLCRWCFFFKLFHGNILP